MHHPLPPVLGDCGYMTQSMPIVAAVTLGFSREELVVTNPGTLGHRMGRRLFMFCLDNLLLPKTQSKAVAYNFLIALTIKCGLGDPFRLRKLLQIT